MNQGRKQRNVCKRIRIEKDERIKFRQGILMRREKAKK